MIKIPILKSGKIQVQGSRVTVGKDVIVSKYIRGAHTVTFIDEYVDDDLNVVQDRCVATIDGEVFTVNMSADQLDELLSSKPVGFKYKNYGRKSGKRVKVQSRKK